MLASSMGTTSSDGHLRRWQQDGDRTALDELLERELPRMRAMLGREEPGLGGGSAGATDALQEAALRVVERESELRFRAAAPLRAFMLATARRFLVDRFRRRARKQPLEHPSLVLERAREEAHAQPVEDVLAALKRLDFSQREVLELTYLHGMELAELGRELGISPDAARMRLARAKARLRELLEHD